MPTPLNLVNVPTRAIGSPGDTKGMIAINSGPAGGSIYFCVKDYDGVSRIWASSVGLSFGAWMTPILQPPPAPVITSYTTSAGNASALFPIISGTTVQGIPLSGYNTAKVEILVFVDGILNYNYGVVSGTYWTFQPYRSLTGGPHSITAKARYVNDGAGTSYESVASSVFNINLTAPAPTLSLQVSPVVMGKSLSWATSNATSVTVNGVTYPASGLGTAITYFFPTNGKSVTNNVTVTAIGPTGLTTSKTITITVDPLPKAW